MPVTDLYENLGDAPGDITTPYSMTIGQTFHGTVDNRGGHDWIAIDLEAGQTISISLNGVTLSDTYLYLRDSDGTLISRNDDGGPGLNSLIKFTVPETAIYYLDAAGYGNYYTGTYRLSVTELISGTTGDDSLIGTAGDDSIVGYAGDDTLGGGSAGHDTLSGGEDDDLIWGGSGDDSLDGSNGNDRLWGGWGEDTIYGGHDNDVIGGGGGDDFLDGGYGNDTIYGDGGNDRIFAYYGDDLVYGGAGNDYVYGHLGNDTLFGNEGNDTIVGVTGNNRLIGGNGSDIVRGGYGRDTLFGNDGNDYLEASSGDDLLIGGDDADVLLGGRGFDTVDYGGNSTGVEMVFVQNHHYFYSLHAAHGGEAEGDVLSSIEVIRGSAHDDVFVAADTAKTFLGRGGDDILTGGDGGDWLLGGAGDDTITGQGGNDMLRGDDGADLFIFAGVFGNDTIQDFAADDAEKIDLSGVSGIVDFADLLANHLSEVNGNAVITTDDGEITLRDVAVADFGLAGAYSADDFLF
ncbi:pre-peptidase C-terminal domain-containing protein [Pseudooceanicola nanhaiensis]|uniref:pre-peptidase C-terminal domain-containing protein n=1 Tax=Pseudooceanicola nanhaiensis TaxID=375761 RepID=UPI0021E5F2B0|nr:pre-peptidase C-terminal domain-containing protein [Pseudooceanicola nanhaiensis]